MRKHHLSPTGKDSILFGVLVHGDCLFFMKNFCDYISFWTVTSVLISKRVQLCDKRHKKHQLHLLSPNLSLGSLTYVEEQIMSLMPPRKSWVSLSTKSRYRVLSGEHRQRKSAARCNWTAIKWTIQRDLSEGISIPYLERLKSFVA